MTVNLTRRFTLAAAGALGATGLGATRLAGTSYAAGLASPKGKVILTISGNIKATNLNDTAVLDMEMIEAIGLEGFSTTTPWYNGPVKFEGVRMSKLLDLVGATGTTVTALALNDYKTDIPMEDFRKYPALMATKRDGAYMPVKDKGPLFIVYPYDSDITLKHQVYYARSAWQVARLIVK